MFKFLKDRKKDNKGFTLVELVIVVAILAILVGILAPQYTKYVEKSRKSADASNLENMVRSIEIAAADATGTLNPGTYTITINTNTTVTAKKGNADNSDYKTAAENVLKNSVSADVLNVKLKSSDWGTAGISATITIGDDYTTTVSYSPVKLEEYIGTKTPTPTTAPQTPQS